MQRNHKCDVCGEYSETLRPLRIESKIIWACEKCREDKSKIMRKIEDEEK